MKGPFKGRGNTFFAEWHKFQHDAHAAAHNRTRRNILQSPLVRGPGGVDRATSAALKELREAASPSAVLSDYIPGVLHQMDAFEALRPALVDDLSLRFARFWQASDRRRAHDREVRRIVLLYGTFNPATGRNDDLSQTVFVVGDWGVKWKGGRLLKLMRALEALGALVLWIREDYTSRMCSRDGCEGACRYYWHRTSRWVVTRSGKIVRRAVWHLTRCILCDEMYQRDFNASRAICLRAMTLRDDDLYYEPADAVVFGSEFARATRAALLTRSIVVGADPGMSGLSFYSRR